MFNKELRVKLFNVISWGPAQQADVIEQHFGKISRPLKISYVYFGQIDPKGVSFELTGGDGGAALSLRGRFVQSNAGVRSELWLEAKTIPANEPLREALAGR